MRCAIYTRKSSEEGLEQDFNSLQAQREACEAYIASQKHEGWIVLPTFYDDGGVSGATLERQALQRLLADVEVGRIDTIVVYKVDRLTRTLSDFARLVEIFDRKDGLLRLRHPAVQHHHLDGASDLERPALLRPVRARGHGRTHPRQDRRLEEEGDVDGRQPALGLRCEGQKLIVNKAEAETVRSIFRQYREIESVRELRDRLAAEGVTSKRRVRRDGSIVGGKPINRGALYHLLHNRLYRGEMVHKDKAYPGQHEAIVDEALWDEVQATLAANTNGERREGTRQPSLLTGLVVDEQGEGLSPSHAVKKGRRYRYYVSRHLILDGQRAGRKGWRLPAADLEGLVTVRLRDWLADAAAISAVIDGDPQEASAHASLITQAQSLADRWPELKPHQAKAYLNALLRRVIVESARIVIEIDGERALATLLAGPDVVSIKRSRQDAQPAKHPIILDIPIALKRAGTGMKLVVPGARNNAKCAPGLIRLLLRAFAIQDRLEQNPDLPLKRIAEAEGVSPSYVTRLLRLAYLAPDIVTAIIDGRQPPGLTANTLMKNTRLPFRWEAQRKRLGFKHA